MNTNQFGDLFTYDCSTDFIGGRRFFSCQLLKDAYCKNKGDWIDIIGLDIPGRIYFNDYENIIGVFSKKEPPLKTIQTEVLNILLNKINTTCFEMWSELEDKYGVCFCLRTCMFIDAYMISLKYEFEKSVCVIKHHWKRVVSNPNYLMCRRRLMREFKNINSI